MIVKWKGADLCECVFHFFFWCIRSVIKKHWGEKSEMKNYLASRLFCYFSFGISTFSSTFYKTHAAIFRGTFKCAHEECHYSSYYYKLILKNTSRNFIKKSSQAFFFSSSLKWGVENYCENTEHWTRMLKKTHTHILKLEIQCLALHSTHTQFFHRYLTYIHFILVQNFTYSRSRYGGSLYCFTSAWSKYQT